MKKILLALPLAMMVQVSVAQNNTKHLTGQYAEENLRSLVINGGSMARTIDTRYAGVKGTPFFLEHYGLATISMVDNRVYDKIRFNYNLMGNTLHYKDEKKVERVLPNSQINSFVLSDSLNTKQYTFINLNKITGVDATHTGRFSLMLFDGKAISLTVMPEKQLLKADYKGGYSSEVTHDEFVDAKTYYIIKDKTSAQKVKLNKNSFLAAFPDKKIEIQQYLKKEKTDLNTEAGWAKVLAYYESI